MNKKWKLFETRLKKDYIIKKILSHNRTSKVFLCLRRKDGLLCVIKQIKLVAVGKVLAENEIKFHNKRINSLNLIKYYDHFYEDNSVYIVTEYVRDSLSLVMK